MLKSSLKTGILTERRNLKKMAVEFDSIALQARLRQIQKKVEKLMEQIHELNNEGDEIKKKLSNLPKIENSELTKSKIQNIYDNFILKNVTSLQNKLDEMFPDPYTHDVRQNSTEFHNLTDKQYFYEQAYLEKILKEFLNKKNTPENILIHDFKKRLNKVKKYVDSQVEPEYQELEKEKLKTF
jgi:hypothetical protein